jgi:hypothetical protein
MARLYNKQDLQNALFEALDSNKTEAEFVQRFAANVGKILKRKPQNYRYFGPYWWPLKKIMIEQEVPGIDDFIDQEWLERADFGDKALNCVAAWAMQETRMEQMEMPANSVLLEDDEGNFEECVVIDPFLEEKIKA